MVVISWNCANLQVVNDKYKRIVTRNLFVAIGVLRECQWPVAAAAFEIAILKAAILQSS